MPKDKDAQLKLKACEKAVREEAFSKAIESEAPAEEIIAVEGIIVEDSYTGPRLETSADGKAIFTMTFLMDALEHMKAQKLVHKKFVIQVLLAAIEHFKSQPSMISLSLPRKSNSNGSETTEGEVNGSFNVCGDTHGQYYDLLNIFQLGGFPSETNYYLFNGDFVDRGSFSFENVFLLLLFKLTMPNALFMLRGNHETKNMNKIYGFVGEVQHKYDDKVMNLFAKLFQCLPLCAVIEKKVFVVHGGLSTQEGGVALDELIAINRFREPPETGLMSDLLWSGKYNQYAEIS